MKMQNYIKLKIRKVFEILGYEIRKYPDIYQKKIYQEIYSSETLAKKPFFNVGAGSF